VVQDLIGGAWEHGKSKFLNGTLGIYVQDYPHEITRGVSNFMMDDEIYWTCTFSPRQGHRTAFRTPHESPRCGSTRRTNYARS